MLPLVAGIVATTGLSARVIERTGRYRMWAVLQLADRGTGGS
jgi:hypothetical protein